MRVSLSLAVFVPLPSSFLPCANHTALLCHFFPAPVSLTNADLFRMAADSPPHNVSLTPYPTPTTPFALAG